MKALDIMSEFMALPPDEQTRFLSGLVMWSDLHLPDNEFMVLTKEQYRYATNRCPHCGVPLTGMNSNPDECLSKSGTMNRFERLTQDHVTRLREAGIFHDQVAGAIPKGTRVVKINSLEGDAHLNGARGTVIGSVGPVMYLGRMTIAYYIAWDDMPGVPVAIMDSRIKREE